jgi:hypothetical protein
LTYQDALQLAAGLGAAAASEQTVTAVVSGLSDQVANTRDTAVDWAFRLIRQLWQRTDPYDGDSVNTFTTAAGARMVTAQSTVARAAAASVTQGLAVMGVRTPAVASDPADVRRLDPVDGRLVERPATTAVDYQDVDGAVDVDLQTFATTDGMFNRPAQRYRYAASQGASTADADRAAQQLIALQIDQNAMLAARLAYAEVLQKTVDLDLPGPRIIGYRRIIHPEMSRTGVCGLCIAASDRIYHIENLLPIHGRCQCTVAPVTADRDPADDLNKVDLAQLYQLAGGVGGASTTAGPALKRVRYQVDEHGELGPVLIPRAARQPRKPVPAPRRSKARVS